MRDENYSHRDGMVSLRENSELKTIFLSNRHMFSVPPLLFELVTTT